MNVLHQNENFSNNQSVVNPSRSLEDREFDSKEWERIHGRTHAGDRVLADIVSGRFKPKARTLDWSEAESEEKSKRKPLSVIMAGDLPDEYEAPDELVEGLLTVGAGSILFGDSNSGKTFFAIDLACAVARGEPWMDRRVQQGLVIYVASESPKSVSSRLQAYRKYHNCEVRNFAIVPEPVNLWQSDEDTDLLIASIKEVEKATGQKAALIIGDTLARMSAGANENSGEDMGMVVSRFDRVRAETGAHFLLIHHTGKDQSKGARGHSSLRAAVDTEVEVKEEASGRYATVTKQRDLMGKGNRIGFALHQIEIGRNRWGSTATNCVVLPADAPTRNPKGKPFSERESKVIALVEETPGITRVVVKEALYAEHPTGMDNVIAGLVKAGHLREEKEGKDKKLFRELPKIGGL